MMDDDNVIQFEHEAVCLVHISTEFLWLQPVICYQVGFQD